MNEPSDTSPSRSASPAGITLNRRGVDMVDSGRYPEAIDAFDRALLLLPDSVGILFNRGEAKRLSGDLAGARMDLERALALEPGAADIVHALGLVAYDSDDFAGAAALYLRALELSPGCAEAWNDLGVVRFRQGDYPAARECFEKTVSFDPDSTEAWFNLADTYDELGLRRERVRALESLRKARIRTGEAGPEEEE